MFISLKSQQKAKEKSNTIVEQRYVVVCWRNTFRAIGQHQNINNSSFSITHCSHCYKIGRFYFDCCVFPFLFRIFHIYSFAAYRLHLRILMRISSIYSSANKKYIIDCDEINDEKKRMKDETAVTTTMKYISEVNERVKKIILNQSTLAPFLCWKWNENM